MDLQTVIVSIFSSGVTAAIITGIYHYFLESRRRRSEYLDRQLQCFYGPLHFFLLQNEKLVGVWNDLREKFRKDYGDGDKYPNDHQTQELIMGELKSIFDLQNEYGREIVKNNRKIMSVLEKYWDCIDPEDSEKMAEFQINLIRYDKESEKEAGVNIPLRVRIGMKEIYMVLPGFFELVRNKFLLKQNERKRLMIKNFSEDNY